MRKRIALNDSFFAGLAALMLLFLSGLAITRLLYEAAFPNLLWLGRALAVVPLALLLAFIFFAIWLFTVRQLSHQWTIWPFTPLLLNLLWLFDAQVDLVASRFIFATSLWLGTLFIAWTLFKKRSWRGWGFLFIVAAVLPIYWLTIPDTVGSADTFEFQVVIPQLGIAHPTGYPLYIFLGRLFSFIPWETMAWRINLASAVFAILTLFFLYEAALRLTRRPLPAILSVVLLGLSPVFWSQAIEAEVYALHAFFVSVTLWLMVLILDNRDVCDTAITTWPIKLGWQRLILLSALLVGLGLTNHLTTLFLLPPALLAILLAFCSCLRRQNRQENLKLLLKAAAAFVLPLLLYAYLPLRWSALNGEPMGMARFVDWVIGGRFQDALQLNAWLTGPTRYEVVGRLLLQNWEWFNLTLAALGLITLFMRRRRAALILILTWLGFMFYGLNYLVPDLAVFLIPAHVVTALFWAAGVAALLAGANRLLDRWQKSNWLEAVQFPLLTLLMLPSIVQIAGDWPAFPQEQKDLLAWGEGVLAMPLEHNAAILADSEKIAPLYYLQQAEGFRPDLDIMVLPDEAAYRNELDGRIATGQTVYLARFLPGLEGIYHLRSFGPLLEVSTQPLMELPRETVPLEQSIGPLQLAGYSLQETADVDPGSTAVTLYWQAGAAPEQSQHIYMRWNGDYFTGEPAVKTGRHPAANYYPVQAWREDEIVSDFHLLPYPLLESGASLDLQVAVGPPFSTAADLDWQTITEMSLPPAGERILQNQLRAQIGRLFLSGVEFPSDIRPQTPLPILVSGYGHNPDALQFSLEPLDEPVSDPSGRLLVSFADQLPPFLRAAEAKTDLAGGRYHLLGRDPVASSLCGWLAPPSGGCILGEVQVSGVPLPEQATNYEDKIALLDVDLPRKELQPGDRLEVNLRWQALTSIAEDYTIFLQVLDEQDQIVGQVDAWPLQGTYPTSQWSPGEIIEDPHVIQLDADLPPGTYRLQIGWYLLADLRRLSVLDDAGVPVDDKVTIFSLVSP